MFNDLVNKYKGLLSSAGNRLSSFVKSNPTPAGFVMSPVQNKLQQLQLAKINYQREGQNGMVGQRLMNNPITMTSLSAFNDIANRIKPAATAMGNMTNVGLEAPRLQSYTNTLMQQAKLNEQAVLRAKTPQLANMLNQRAGGMYQQAGNTAQNYNQQGQLNTKGYWGKVGGAMATAGQAYSGAGMLTPASAMVGAGLGGLFAKLGNQNVWEGAGKGLSGSLIYGGAGRFTQPFLTALTSSLIPQAAPVIQRSLEVALNGLSSAIDNELITRLNGEIPQMGDRILAFTIGAGLNMIPGLRQKRITWKEMADEYAKMVTPQEKEMVKKAFYDNRDRIGRFTKIIQDEIDNRVTVFDPFNTDANGKPIRMPLGEYMKKYGQSGFVDFGAKVGGKAEAKVNQKGRVFTDFNGQKRLDTNTSWDSLTSQEQKKALNLMVKETGDKEVLNWNKNQIDKYMSEISDNWDRKTGKPLDWKESLPIQSPQGVSNKAILEAEAAKAKPLSQSTGGKIALKPSEAWNIREESYNKIDKLKEQANKTLWENSVTKGDKIKFDPKSQAKAKQLLNQIEIELTKIKEMNSIIETQTGGGGAMSPSMKVGGQSLPVNKAPEIQPTKAVQPLQTSKGLKENPSSASIISPNAYNAEATPKTIKNVEMRNQKAVQTQQDKDFREWSQMVFKQEGASIKNKDKAFINIIGREIEQNTDRSTAKRILGEKVKAKQELLTGQSEARKAFVTNKKGYVITSKGGSPMDRDVVIKAQEWKDKSKMSYGRETMDRNFEDIMGSDAPQMKERYIAPVKKAEADRIRWLNKERGEIKALGIAPKSKESKLVQQLGEGLISKDTVLKEPNGQKIVKAEQALRQKYDRYLDEINEVLKRNGYDPIPRRKDYFRHFTEVQGMLEQFGIPVRDNKLPTDINGLTADFRPGKNFFSSALERKGNTTDYDAIAGIDGYIDGASKQIFHTDNIQNLRLLDNSIRETFAGTNHLSNFVADLTEYTNNLAGKKSMIDRSVESLVGRNIYGAANRLKRQTGANMVGMNIASAATNYIPLTQALATTDKLSFTKGMLQTIASVFKDDGFVNRSDFLTRRVGSDRLAVRTWDKIGNKGMWFMKTIDNFTSGTIVRGKYYEGIKRGLSPSQAMKRADDWAARTLADRSLGSMPTMFNSKTLGFLTQFQLEVNNQLSFMFKDIPRNYNKVGAASALGQVFIYSYIFNNLYEKAFGRRPAFDPIGVAQQTYEDYTNPDMKKGQATKNLIKNASDQLPFVSIVTGGRIPIGGALPDPVAIAKGESTIGKEIKKPLYYVLPPTAGGQIKKTIEGIGAFSQGASTADSGNVRYPIPQTPVNAIRTALGGQYSTPEARQYFREGRTPLGEKQSEMFMNSQDKTGTYNTFMDKRQESKADDKAKAELKASNGKMLEKNNKVYILQDNGDIKTIDTSFQPTPPNLTGNAELDKKLISKYKGEITSKQNDIVALYEAGKIDQNEAEKQLQELKKKSSVSTGAKKGKKPSFKIKTVKVPKIKVTKVKKIKVPKPKKIKSYRLKMPKIKKAKIKLSAKLT